MSQLRSTSAPSCWIRTSHGRIAVLTFHRPPENTLSFHALEELTVALIDVERDPTVSVVVLTGGLSGYFVAHADLGDVGRMARGEPPQGDPEVYRRTLRRLERLHQPTVAAVNGQAWGAVCELALACNLRLLATSAHVCQLEVSKGAIPGAGGTVRLPRIIGTSRASELIWSSRVVDAQEALALGLANAVLPDDAFLDHVLHWLEPIACQPRHALLAAKQSIVEGLYLPLEAALDNEQRLFRQTVSSKEFKEE